MSVIKFTHKICTAVSGAGNQAVQELYSQTKDILDNKEAQAKILPVKNDKKHYQIAFNAIPQIDVFQDNGFTFEEMVGHSHCWFVSHTKCLWK